MKTCQCACGCEAQLDDDDPNDCCSFCSEYCPDFNEHPEWLPTNKSKGMQE